MFLIVKIKKSFFKMFIYLGGGHSTSWGGVETEERETPKQAGSTLSAQSPMWGSDSQNCEIMAWAEIKSRIPNRLSHPGAP